jgi:hypothetical protein
MNEISGFRIVSQEFCLAAQDRFQRLNMRTSFFR